MIQMAKPSRSPVHIGYLVRMYPRFSQTFIVNEILELERQGLRVSIASLRKPTDGLFHEQLARVKAKAHYIPEHLLSDFGRLWTAQWARLKKRPKAFARGMTDVLRHAGADWIDLAQAAYVLKWAKKNKIDHVHVHFGTNEATVAYLANILGGLSYSLTLHAFDVFRENVDRPLLARKINASQFTITVSAFNRRYIQTEIPGVLASKVRVNYNGIDLERFNHTEQPREPALVFSVGRLIEKKGFIHLIRAIRRLNNEELRVSCKIAGDGRERGVLQREIQKHGLESAVELVGSLEQGEVSALMNRATCFALPCVQAADGNIDALPTVLLESLASACPSISTRLSGIPEIIENRTSGLLVPPGDDKALALAIREVVEDSSLARSLGEGGRHRAVDQFDVRQNVAVMHAWLRDAARADRSAEPEEAGERAGALAIHELQPLVAGASPC